MNELLQAEQLTLTRNGTIICQDFSFNLYPGDFLGVLGINGRGKTSLLHTLAGLILPLSGHIKLGNENLLKLSRRQIALKIGLLLQEERQTFPISVHDTIKNGRYARRREKNSDQDLKEILSDLNLTHFENRNFLNLSGGEQRRVSIGRILFQSPEILLLDEPTNHLDPVYQQIVLTKCQKLCKEQKAIMMAGHNINLMKLFCNRFLLLLENGDVLIGSAEEVLTQENLYAVYKNRGCDFDGS